MQHDPGRRAPGAFRTVTVRQIFLMSLVVRVPLLIMAPVSLYIDGITRYIPDATRLIHFDLSFSDPPLYSLLLAPPAAVLGLRTRSRLRGTTPG